MTWSLIVTPSIQKPTASCRVWIPCRDARYADLPILPGASVIFGPLGRRACVEQLGHRRNQLGWSKRLVQQNAVGHAFRRPIVAGSARHVDDGNCRIDLPDKARNLPTLGPLRLMSVTSAEYLTTPLSIIATAS